jgi:2,3,4,5-tetrahydropyridine-2-carboxylate N-succinyltransferase
MLQPQIEALFDVPPAAYVAEHFALFDAFKAGLNRGEIRAAEPDPASRTGWRVNLWVKKGILLGFRMGAIVDMSVDARRQPFFDKSTYPVHAISAADGVRIVPGGSSIRDGPPPRRLAACSSQSAQCRLLSRMMFSSEGIAACTKARS